MLGIRTRTILHVLRIALLVALGMGAYVSDITTSHMLLPV